MCSFCDELKKQVEEEERAKAYQGLNWKDGRHMEYSVFLAGNLFDGRSVIYRWSFGEYRLRFCPECGANIARRMRQWTGGQEETPKAGRKKGKACSRTTKTASSMN